MTRRRISKTPLRPVRSRRRLAARRAQRYQIRWFHVLAGCIGAFALGYLVGAAHITSYAQSVLAQTP
jgi:hypothetical protein